MSWTVPSSTEPGGATTGDERAILLGYHRWQRTALLRICAGLTAEQLASRPLASTALSLQGLIRHYAKVERIWLRTRVAGQDVPPLLGGAGDPADFDDTDPARAESEVAALQQEWRDADAAVAHVPLDHEIVVHGETLSLRMVYVHLIGEYARHNGHADLLREAIDGVTGR
ncbi:DinB family protein [Jatrophihabitans fulvus]